MPPSKVAPRAPTAQPPPPQHGYRILSFDGGGLRTLSSLIILQSFMKRLTRQLEGTSPSTTNISLRPCDHFDLICGSGTGGLLALLLGRLGMTTDEVIKEYLSFAPKCFAMPKRVPQGWLSDLNKLLTSLGRSSMFDEDVLKSSLEDIVSRRSGYKDSGMESLKGAKTLVLASTPAMGDAPPRCFRSYHTNHETADSTFIVDVARASCATPGLFSPINIDNEDLIDASSCGFANPTEVALDEAEKLWPEAQVGCVLSLGTGLQGVVRVGGSWTAILQAYQNLIESSSDVEYRVFKRLRAISPPVYFRFNVDRGLHKEWINDKGTLDIAGITTGYLRIPQQESRMDACVARHSPGNDHIIITAEMRSRLETLHPIIESTWRHGSVCTPETRVDILREIQTWARNLKSPRVFWLHGPAKSGKSTIAETIVQNLGNSIRTASTSKDAAPEPLLGAFLRCDNTVAPNQVLLSIFSEMAKRIPRYAIMLSNALRDPYVVPRASPQRQIQELLVKLKHSLDIAHPIVVVFDALDECGDGSSRKDLLAALMEEFPREIKLFITSRVESDITRAMDRIRPQKFTLNTRDNIEDVQKVLRHQLQDIRDDHYGIRDAQLSQTWISDEDIDKLVKRAGGHFTYAEFIVSLLRDADDPRVILQELLSDNLPTRIEEHLDQLYLTALREACPENAPHSRHFKSIMGSFLLLKYPLKLPAFCDLVGLQKVEMKNLARLLVLALHGTALTYQDDGVLSVLHPSLAEFVTSRCQDPSFSLKSSNCAEQLALCCFTQLKLLRDIGRVKSAFSPSGAVDISVPEALQYACRFWVSHLPTLNADSPDANSRLDQLIIRRVKQEVESFMLYRLLLWIEVMSLLKELSTAQCALEELKIWLSVIGPNERLENLADDGIRFILLFRSALLQANPFHAHYSALPFIPCTAELSKAVRDRYQGIPRIVTHQSESWGNCYMSLIGHKDCVRSVAFSQDGSHIISVSLDVLPHIWETATGAEAMKPPNGQISPAFSRNISRNISRVTSGLDNRPAPTLTVKMQEYYDPLRSRRDGNKSIAFSRDGSCIVSGSFDCKVRVWNTISGKQIGTAFTGHAASVSSVAFSPDSSRIASGSFDGAVRIWEAAKGDIKALQDHTTGLLPVAFSNDDSRSGGRTVSLWETAEGDSRTLKDPTAIGGVSSVAFSLNSSHVVSGSDDGIVRVWDARSDTSTKVFCKLIGHTAKVSSVAFSQDPNTQSRIVSGSEDGTVRIWDTKLEAGNQAIATLRGHIAKVSSVAFSYDGIRVVSGSSDCTVRVWDLQEGNQMVEILRGHTDTVGSVAFSPDNTRVVSGSDDRTVRVWDAQRKTINRTDEPLQCKITSISSVTFSSDGARLISCFHDDTALVWDTNTGNFVHAGAVGERPDGRSEAIDVDPNGGITLSDKFKFMVAPGVKCVIHRPTKRLAYWGGSIPLTIVDLSPVSLLDW